MTPVAPRIVYFICDEDQRANLFAWQGQYFVRFEGDTVDLRIVNDVSYVTRIQPVSHFC